MKKIIKGVNTTLMQIVLIGFISGCCGNNAGNQSNNQETKFKLVELPSEKKVEVRIDDHLFTSYIYPDHIAKPVLYPIRTASGKVLSRGFPLDTIPGERIDHPHHVGHWMNYGDVNGLDFWNNSESIPEDKKDKYGSIFHKKVTNIKEGDESGILGVVNDWKTPDGTVLIEEHTRFIFSANQNTRIIDRISTLKALNNAVSFNDNKEGMFAVRVSRAMELPSENPDVFMDAHGNPTATKVLDNTGVNGNYLSSEGNEGMEVWGTRARWMNLHSTIEGEQVALVIIDHPDNIGYPTYWHARGYGLFAANPLGQSVFTGGEKVLNFKLAPTEEVTFKYRILVHSGGILSSESIDAMADQFARQ